MPAKLKRIFSDPVSIVLVVVIVLALVFAGLLGGELYARNRADTVVAGTVECVVQDDATASFGVMPPFLFQHASGHYDNIQIETAGKQIREAKGMKAEIVINDVQVTNNPAAPGTVGALDAKITWSADGIKRTIQNAIPLIGSFVNGVTTNPSDGTIELQGMLGSIVAKPEVRNNELTLTVEALTGPGLRAATRVRAAGAGRVPEADDRELPAGHQGRQRGGHRFRGGRASSSPATPTDAGQHRAELDPCFAGL